MVKSWKCFYILPARCYKMLKNFTILQKIDLFICHSGLNSLNDKVAIIKKPVNWFAEQINSNFGVQWVNSASLHSNSVSMFSISEMDAVVKADGYLEPSRTSMMELLCENS